MRSSVRLLNVVRTSAPDESYRRPNLPNLFSPRVWDDDKIHILYLIPAFPIGGAEVFDLRIFECLPRDIFHIVLVACENWDTTWKDEFRPVVDEIYILERMGADPQTRMAFLRYLMIAKSIDIVFNRNTFFGYEIASEWPAISSQVRYVDLLHLHAYGDDWVRASAPYHGHLHLRYVISASLREYACRQYGLSSDPFRVLYYGMSNEEMPSMAVALGWRTQLRRELNISESAFVVGFVGRIADQKRSLCVGCR